MVVRITQATQLEEWRLFINEHSYLSETHLISSTNVNSGKFSLTSVQAGMLGVDQYCGPESATRRSWQHIRKSSCESYLMWFPLEGHVVITHDQEHENLIGAGDFFVTCGNRPHQAKSFSGSSEACRQLFVWVPSHIMRSRVPQIDYLCGRKFSGEFGPGGIGAHLFGQLLAQGDNCSPDCLSTLGEAALTAVCDTIRSSGPAVNTNIIRHSASLERVMRFIDRNFTKPGLTAGQVARACSLSIRSLHYLLRSKQTTFSTYLRTVRLRQAREWLRDPEFSHFNVVDIAYMAGFKSASHFSNAYRNHFGTAPRELRKAPIVSTAVSTSSTQNA
jgi:AraC family transcriptional regulator, positive regulator of tynA and feaB